MDGTQEPALNRSLLAVAVAASTCDLEGSHDDDGEASGELLEIFKLASQSFDGVIELCRLKPVYAYEQEIIYFLGQLNRPQLIALAAQAHSRRKGTKMAIADGIVCAACKSA